MSDYTLRNGDRLHDADTIYPAKGPRVRLSLGDAPEVINAEKQRVAAPGSAEATAATRVAIEEEGYKLTPGGEKDRYGRDLGTIAAPAGGPSAEQEMVADGLMMPGHWKTIDDGGASAAALQMRGAQELTGTKPSALQQNEEYQALVEQGRTARLDWLQERINSGRMREDTLYMAAPKDERKTEFQGDTLDDLGDVTAVAGRSWKRGVDNTQSTLYGFADALGSATGIDILEKYGEEGVATNVVEAMRNPATLATYEDIEGLGDFMIYGMEAVGENSFQLLADLGIGAATGGTATLSKYALAAGGKALLRQTGGALAISKAREIAAKGMLGASARLGFMDAAKAGSIASMYAQVTGETQNQLVAEGIDSPETALLTGIPKAALDYVGLSTVLRSGLGKVGFKAGMTPQSATELLGRTASSVGIAATTEGLTEATQTLMDELAIKGHKPDYQINMTSIIDAMLKGSIGGGTFAGAGAALTGAAQMGVNGSQAATDVPVPEASTLPVAEPAPEIPANNAPAQATAPEPLADIQAQLRSTPEGEGNWYTSENAEQAKQVAAEQGKATLDLPDGSVAVGTPEVLATLPAEPTQADLAKLNGYAQTKEEAAADPAGTVVVEVRDESGAVLRNQVVGKSIAEEVVAAQQAKFPAATVEITTAEAAVARRGQAVNEGDLRLEAASAGVNIDDFMESAPVEDVAASRRLLVMNLSSELKDTGTTLKEELGNRRVEALSDAEVGTLLGRLDITERPAKFGGVSDLEGNTSPEVEAQYRAQVASDIASLVEAKFADKGISLAPLAQVFGVDGAQLQRSHYGRGGDKSPTVLFKANVKKLIREKFKDLAGMKVAMQQLPAAELHTLAAQLGVKVPGYKIAPQMSEPKLNRAALQSEIKARSATTDKDMSIGAPVAPLSERESAERQPWQEKILAAVDVAKELQGLLYGKTEATLKKEGAHIRSTKARIKSRPIWGALKSLSVGQQREVVGRVNELVGHAPYSQQRQDFVNALREALVAQKGNAERKVAADNVYNDDGELISSTLTQTEELTDMLDRDEEQMLDALLVSPALNMGDWSGASKKWGDQDSRERAGLFLRAIQRMVSVSEVFNEDAAPLPSDTEARINQVFLISAALQAFMPAGASPKRFAPAVIEAVGLTDADVQAGADATATAEALVADLPDKTSLAQRQAVARRVANILGVAPDVLEAAAEAGIEADDARAAVTAYLTQLLDDESTAPLAVSLISSAVTLVTLRGPVDAAQLVTSHEAVRRDEKRAAAHERVTAQAEREGIDPADVVEGDEGLNPAWAQGARDTPVVTSNEDESSEQSFFGALWSARAKNGAFRKGSKSLTTTEAMGGRNLQEVSFTIHGYPKREQFDMVAMAMYAQSGEHVPATPVEAMHNLLANIGRAAVGPMTAGVDNPAIFDVLTLPKTDTVIFIDPVTGEGVTFGQASGLERAAQREQRDGSEMMEERDQLSVEMTLLGEMLHSMAVKLRADALDAAPDDKFALLEWAKALDSKGYKRPKMTGAQTAAFERVGRRVIPMTTQKQAAQDVGVGPMHLADATLRAVNSRRISAGSRIKKLNTQLEELDAYAEFDPDAERKRTAALELAGNAGKINGLGGLYGSEYDMIGTDVLAERAARGGPALEENQEAFAPDPDPYTHLHSRPLRYGKQAIAASGERLDAILRSAKEAAGISTADQQAPVTQRGVGPGPVPDSVPVPPRKETPKAVRAVRGARDAHRRKGMERAQARERADILDPNLPNRKVPQGRESEVSDPVYRPNKAAPTEVPTGGKPAQVLSAEERAERAPAPVRTEGVHGGAAQRNVVNMFMQSLKRKGIPLPAINMHISPRTLAELHATVDESEYTKLEEAWDNGGSFYLRTENGALIVLRPKDRSHAELLLDLAHELGHAVKDQVWMDLNAIHRYELAKAFVRDTKLDAKQRFDDSLLHEWFADQFAQAALDETAKEAASDGSILGRIVELAKHIRGIWQALTGRLPGIAPEFSQFAQTLFAGGYAHAEGRATNITPVVRFADGAQGLHDAGFYSRATVQAKRFMQTGAIPNIASRVFRMVISRINGYSPELAGMLFQQAGKDASVHGRAWGQQSEALRARMQGQIAPVVAAIEAGVKGKATKRLAVRQAFQDAATGTPITAGGKQVRALMDSLALQARKDGLRSVQLDPGFTIAVFSREQVDKRRVEFETMLAARLGEGVDVKAAVTRIVEGTGVIEGAIAPGMPVGTHATTRSILEAIPFAELQAGGWLLDEPEAAMYHWIDGMAKRTAWDAVFGAHVEGLDHNRVAMAVFGQEDPSMKRMLAAGLMTEDGKVFDANAKYKVLMERIREQHGVSAAAEVQDMIDGAMGRHGQNMPGTIRRTYDAVVSWTGLTILAFSGLASIPELAMPLVRGGGKVKLGDVFRDIGQARQFSRDMGIVMSDMADRVSWQLMGEQYQSPMMQKITHQFFKWNGNKAIVDFSRYMAVSVAMRYLQSAAESGDHGALHRLNIDAATVDAWVAAGRPAWNPGLPEAQQGPARAAADAINQFVGEATLRPSRFQATNWGNNPWMKFIWQLKHFLYTYGDTVLGGIWRETSRRWKNLDSPDAARALSVATPALLFGVFMLPLAAAAGEARDWIRRLNGQRSQAPTGNGMERALGYVENAFMRAGGLGPLSVLEGMSMAAEYDRSPILALSPVLAKLEYLADFGDEEKTGKGKEGPSLGDKARSLVPVVSQNKGLFSD